MKKTKVLTAQAVATLTGYVLTIFPMAAHPAEGLSVAIGHEYSRGTYGNPTATEINATVLQTKYEYQNWLFKLALPYITLNGPAVVSTNTVTANNTSSLKNRKIEGIGDAVISGSYFFNIDPKQNLGLEIGSKLKVPTATPDSGLGTEKFDYALEATAYKNLDRITFLMGVGQKWNGRDSNSDYRDTTTRSLGMILRTSETASIGIIADHRQSLFRTSQDQHEYSIFASNRFNSRTSLQLYAFRGTTTSSPNFGLGAAISHQF